MISNDSKFQADLLNGQKFERRVRRIFESQGRTVRPPANNERRWDFELLGRCGEKWLRVECKCDFKAKTTGNIAVEGTYNNKSSGLFFPFHDVFVYGIGASGAVYSGLSSTFRGLVKSHFQDETGSFWHKRRKFGEGATGFLLPLEVLKRARGIYRLE